MAPTYTFPEVYLYMADKVTLTQADIRVIREKIDALQVLTEIDRTLSGGLQGSAAQTQLRGVISNLVSDIAAEVSYPAETGRTKYA
jgi:hypothetical protein